MTKPSVRLLDCGHIITARLYGGKEHWECCEVVTMPEGHAYYQHDCPRWYSRRTRVWNERETWHGPTHGRRVGALANGGTLSTMCNSCWAEFDLQRTLQKKEGSRFYVTRPSGWQQRADKSQRWTGGPYIYPYNENRIFTIEHGPSGKKIGQTMRARIRDHSWHGCASLHLWFRWEHRLWYGRNIFNEHDPELSSRVFIKELNPQNYEYGYAFP